MNRDLYSRVNVVKSIVPIVGNNTTEGTGVGVDLQGYESALVVFEFGDSGDTLSGTVKMQASIDESDDNSNWTAASGASSVKGTADVIDAPTEDQVVQTLGYVGSKRYIRALVTFTGTHTNGTPISACVIRGSKRHMPAQT